MIDTWADLSIFLDTKSMGLVHGEVLFLITPFASSSSTAFICVSAYAIGTLIGVRFIGLASPVVLTECSVRVVSPRSKSLIEKLFLNLISSFPITCLSYWLRHLIADSYNDFKCPGTRISITSRDWLIPVFCLLGSHWCLPNSCHLKRLLWNDL